ncbi:methionine ABC transporter ATP-binding protein [Psychrobacter sp.]|uniref:methionine ABC transporter ATP-binding protein n=1 Tax=Psychrobacter sp. TaxID=56811 RepID=UPI0025F047A4|nr:methionine ABC transporter ATP-binding protein [Psychrobacter sp.]
MSDMIVLDQVYKKFQTQKDGKLSWFTAVEPISLSIKQGEIFGLMGYSGAGKSTLLRLMNLLERPDGGSVTIDGEVLTDLNPKQLRVARHNVGMIFQQFNLMSNRTVFDNVAFNLNVSGYAKANIYSRVMECLEIVNLTDRANYYPAQLSGGQKQRVGIARAIAPNPKVLLADEPTSALDPSTTRALLSTLKEVNKKLGVTIVIVTHEMSVIRRICNRAALLDQGKLLEVADITNGQIIATTEIGRGLVQED